MLRGWVGVLPARRSCSVPFAPLLLRLLCCVALGLLHLLCCGCVVFCCAAPWPGVLLVPPLWCLQSNNVAKEHNTQDTTTEGQAHASARPAPFLFRSLIRQTSEETTRPGDVSRYADDRAQRNKTRDNRASLFVPFVRWPTRQHQQGGHPAAAQANKTEQNKRQQKTPVRPACPVTDETTQASQPQHATRNECNGTKAEITPRPHASGTVLLSTRPVRLRRPRRRTLLRPACPTKPDTTPIVRNRPRRMASHEALTNMPATDIAWPTTQTGPKSDRQDGPTQPERANNRDEYAPDATRPCKTNI